MSVVESRNENPSPLPAPTDHTQVSKPPPGVVATRLAAALQSSERPLCYVALSEGAVVRIAEAFSTLFSEIEVIVFPPWDCLPYDRVPPSPHCMGLRMDALRIWSTPSGGPRLFLTSLDATLQRIPPETVISKSHIELAVGKPLDRDAFSDFAQRTGYQAEGVADDPGELAVREAVIDIYPAGAPGPMRIVLSEDETVKELRGFDRSTQRTESYLDQVTFGPASECIYIDDITEDRAQELETTEQLLLRLYHDMPTVFDILGDTTVLLAPGATESMERYLEIIEDARQSRADFGDNQPSPSCSLYLDRAEWERLANRFPADMLDLENVGDIPVDISGRDPRKALVEFVQNQLREGMKVVIAGKGKTAEAIGRRLAKAGGKSPRSVDTWEAVLKAKPGLLLSLACDLDQGFVDAGQNVVVIAATDRAGKVANSKTVLAEAELRIGDVLVHEDHGVGVLKNMENITVDDVSRDAARLGYRDGGFLLVPMEEFGKLWRYGSEPEAITLDRLHTDAWQKKRDKIQADIQSTARHMDEAIVGFAQGDGDVLLATNIIENGLDVPRANTMFIWHADRFGLAQLHQLRGRVGRGAVQGIATLLTEPNAELAEETRIRLSTLAENDRLGAGLAISLRDLDLRGGGDIAGEDQAGHMKAIGIGLYQKLLAGAVGRLRGQPSGMQQRAVVNLGNAGTIPLDYVPDPAVRLNLYAKLLRASAVSDLNDLEEEFEDRFGEPPHDVLLLLRTNRLQLVAGRLGVTKLEAGPKALAITLTEKTSTKLVAAATKAGAVRREARLIFEASSLAGEDPSYFFDRVLSAAADKGFVNIETAR